MTYSYRIEQAIRAASVLHKDQKRRGRVRIPYVSHLFSVACIISEYTEDEDTIIAGLLHDTVEDTGYTFVELEEDFGETVANIVRFVTKPEVDDSVEVQKGMWKIVHQKYATQLKQAPEPALIVAAADKIHNMRSMIEEYYESGDRFKRDFAGSLDERMAIYQSISNTLNSRLKNDIVHEFNHVFDEYKAFIQKIQ